jgi:hypothetical protein
LLLYLIRNNFDLSVKNDFSIERSKALIFICLIVLDLNSASESKSEFNLRALVEFNAWRSDVPDVLLKEFLSK